MQTSDNASDSKSPSVDRSSAQFPWRLHELLSEVEKNGKDSIISWLPATDAFKVHNKNRFTAEILPSYFNATKYKSFQRNLNLWGFETIPEGPNKGACYHSLFIRNDREKCHYMTRQKVKGNPARPNQHTSGKAGAKAKASGVFGTLRGATSLSALADLATQANNTSLAASIPLEAVRGKTSKIEDLKGLTFPMKLHHILAREEFTDCVCWTPDGRCLRVVDPFKFQEKVSTQYFSHNSFSSFLVELESYGFKKVSHMGYQECYYHDLLIRGCSYLSKYMNEPQDSKKFVSEDPKKDLEIDHAFGSPSLRDPLAPAAAAAGLSQLKNILGPGTSQSGTSKYISSNPTTGALVQEIQQRQQLAAMLLAGGTSQPTSNLSPALGLGGLGAGLLGARRASLPSSLGLGHSASVGNGSSAPTTAKTLETTPQNKLPISSFLANSSQSSSAAATRSEAV